MEILLGFFSTVKLHSFIILNVFSVSTCHFFFNIVINKYLISSPQLCTDSILSKPHDENVYHLDEIIKMTLFDFLRYCCQSL